MVPLVPLVHHLLYTGEHLELKKFLSFANSSGKFTDGQICQWIDFEEVKKLNDDPDTIYALIELSHFLEGKHNEALECFIGLHIREATKKIDIWINIVKDIAVMREIARMASRIALYKEWEKKPTI